MRTVVLVLSVLLALAPPALADALLVVGNSRDRAMAAHEQAIIHWLQDRRKRAGLSAQQLPILAYHVDVPAERRYCEGRLGIRPADTLFVGLARLAADRLPSEVLDGERRVVDVSAAAPYFARATASLAPARGGLGAPLDVEARFTRSAADGDAAMKARDYGAAAAAYGEASGLHPDDWRMAAGQASALVALARWDEAAEAASRAIGKAPGEALPHGLLGLARAGQGRAEEASAELLAAIGASPEWAVPHAWRARFALSRRDLDTARREASLAVDLDPKQALAHYVLGTVALQQWSLSDAEGRFRSASTFEPDWSAPLDLLGWTLVLGGRFPLAEAAYRRLTPLDGPAAFLGMALSRHAAGDDAAALTWIDQAKAARERDATILAVRAFILAGLGRGEEAEKEAQAAIVLDIHNPNAWEALGDALIARGQAEGAIDDYARAEQILRGWPEPELYYRWAVACQQAGRREEALTVARRGLERYPGSSWSGRLEALLAR
jgi:tetratricopeptide (TPR) repeat protein